jgi:hypothetical protein
MPDSGSNSIYGCNRFTRGFLWSVLLLWSLPSSFAQVDPAEIKHPQLKASEQTYFSRLISLNQSISLTNFPFQLSLNRNVGLDPKDQAGADKRGLEFIFFNERELLKISANYNAAFNSGLLSPNQRASRVLNEVILPMLRLLPGYFDVNASFDGFGFEIGYHVQTHKSSHDYEGKENLVVIFDKADGFRYPILSDDTLRQEILNRSEIYLNGDPFGLALNMTSPMEVDTLPRRPAPPANKTFALGRAGAPSGRKTSVAELETAAKTAETSIGTAEINALREKYQSQLDAFGKEGVAQFHFADYAPPSLVVINNQLALQAALRNPEVFDKEGTSIYKRAARSFDLFLAPQLKGILAKIPEGPEIKSINFNVLNQLASADSGKFSEAIEFLFPLKEARQFASSDITNQDLIDRSIVRINGVRIALNLAQVE